MEITYFSKTTYILIRKGTVIIKEKRQLLKSVIYIKTSKQIKTE